MCTHSHLIKNTSTCPVLLQVIENKGSGKYAVSVSLLEIYHETVRAKQGSKRGFKESRNKSSLT